MSVKKKEDVRITKTKAAVRKAFLELAAQNKISDISITDISDAAGINRTTFYLHYKTIDDIYQDLISEHTSACRDIIECHVDEIMEFDFCGCATEFVDYLDREFGRNSELNCVGFVGSFQREICNIMCYTIMGLYKESGKYAVVSERVLSGIVYSIISIITDWMSSDRSVPISDLCKEFRNIILNGIKK